MEKLFDYIYLLPAVGAIMLVLYAIFLLAPKKEVTVKPVYDALDRPFDKGWQNDIYEMSFKAPFNSLMPEDSRDIRAVALNQKIARAGLSRQMDYRVLTTLQCMLLFGALILTFILGFIVMNSMDIWALLFNLSAEDTDPLAIFTVIGIILVLCAFIPKIVISLKANSVKREFIKNLPVLQNFVVSMMKSGRPISDVLFTLGDSDTVYRDIFANAYRIFIRDKEHAYDYLEDAFHGTGWTNTISLLRTNDKYSIEETTKALSGMMKSLEDEVQVLKGAKRGIKALISEGSIALPFLAVMLLGVSPILMWGIVKLGEALSMGI